MHIIGISGGAGVGKDYLTQNILVPMISGNYKYIVASFADHFKIDCIVKDGLDTNKVYGKKDDKTRMILQKRGTEEGRNIFGNDIWIHILNERLTQYENRGIRYCFITDCRFENEVEYIKSQNGIVIRVEAEDRQCDTIHGENKNHPSEVSLSHYNQWDYVIDNSKKNLKVFEECTEICSHIQEHFAYPETIFYIVKGNGELNQLHYKKHIVFICDKYTFINYIRDNRLNINLYDCENTQDFEYLMEKYISLRYEII